MRRFIVLSLLMVAAPLHAATFDRAPIAPDLGLDALTRGVARERLGRDVFANPWSTVTIGSVDVYDVFPYVESRTWQVVSDPRWNRLVYGEPGRTLRAYDGRGQSLGALSAPRGLAADDRDRVYVADAGNDRIVILQAASELGEVRLAPVGEITGLSDPHDVAWSDGGTPFVADDDWLYVADTGRNRVLAYALAGATPRLDAALGDLGSGTGRFAGPMAIAAGPGGRDVYVADAHTRRIVRLQHAPGRLAWVGETRHDAEVLTSLDTDRWGNLYAAAPREGVIRKYAPDLAPVAELRDAVARPRAFHLPFVTVTDHRVGRVERVGRPNALSVDEWGDASGLRLWSLGVEVLGLAIVPGDRPQARFTLTDRADVTVEVLDASGGAPQRRSIGVLDAGVVAVPLPEGSSGGTKVVRVSAASSYPGGPTASGQVLLAGQGAVLPSRPALIGNTPNPVQSATRIAFLVPAGARRVTLRVFDASGRRVRSFEGGFSPGLREVLWNGTDERGRVVPAGVYVYRLDVDDADFSRKLVLVR